jgi:hypothetical protein
MGPRCVSECRSGHGRKRSGRLFGSDALAKQRVHPFARAPWPRNIRLALAYVLWRDCPPAGAIDTACSGSALSTWPASHLTPCPALPRPPTHCWSQDPQRRLHVRVPLSPYHSQQLGHGTLEKFRWLRIAQARRRRRPSSLLNA